MSKLSKRLSWKNIPVRIYTDGSHSPKSQNGGWGYVVVVNNHETQSNAGFVPDTTNNRMELLAILRCLLEVVRPQYPIEKVLIVTDSSSSVNVIQNVMAKKREGIDYFGYSNRDIVNQIVVTMMRLPNTELHWVKGHIGHRWNERADELAVDARVSLDLKKT